jgi:ribonuclease HII
MQIIDDSDDSEIEVGFEPEEKQEIKIKEIAEIKEETKIKTKGIKKVKETISKDPKPKDTKPKRIKKVNNVKEEKEENEPKKEKLDTVVPECLLKKYYNLEDHIIEIGADEAGRGPMFGRVYSGAVVLPKGDSFDHYKMKDSKKFTSKNSKKINEVAEYIKENAIAWAVEYEDEKVIDEINILQATQSAMHKAIKNVIRQLMEKNIESNPNNLFLLIDGNYFTPLRISSSVTHIPNEFKAQRCKLLTMSKSNETQKCIPYTTIEGGDNKFTSIAAASILAKVERDKYIEQLCLENPELIEKYGLDSNKGYGSKKHMDGIKKHGITKWHRRTFGICKEYV